MSLRKAINNMCKVCTYDPKDKGTCNQQIASCTIQECPLHPVRPIARNTILPKELLDHWRIKIEDLDERARVLVEPQNDVLTNEKDTG